LSGYQNERPPGWLAKPPEGRWITRMILGLLGSSLPHEGAEHTTPSSDRHRCVPARMRREGRFRKPGERGEV